MKKNIDINIDTIKVEGIDIKNIHLLHAGIEQELKQMIIQNGYPNGYNSIRTNTLVGSTLKFSNSLNATNVAQSIASSIYTGMKNSSDGGNTTI